MALNLASMTAIKNEILPIDDVAVHILKMLNNYYPDILLNRYNLSSLSNDFEDNYEIISKKLGIVVKGNELDFERISKTIVNDLSNNIIKGITFDRFNDGKNR